jgi:hypothetical protein
MIELPSDQPFPMKSVGPAMIDQRLREAILYCWLLIPEEHRWPETVEREINRLVKRAFDNYREDLKVLDSLTRKPDAPSSGS